MKLDYDDVIDLARELIEAEFAELESSSFANSSTPYEIAQVSLNIVANAIHDGKNGRARDIAYAIACERLARQRRGEDQSSTTPIIDGIATAVVDRLRKEYPLLMAQARPQPNDLDAILHTVAEMDSDLHGIFRDWVRLIRNSFVQSRPTVGTDAIQGIRNAIEATSARDILAKINAEPTPVVQSGSWCWKSREGACLLLAPNGVAVGGISDDLDRNGDNCYWVNYPDGRSVHDRGEDWEGARKWVVSKARQFGHDIPEEF